jgi:hypothetical protein
MIKKKKQHHLKKLKKETTKKIKIYIKNITKTNCVERHSTAQYVGNVVMYVHNITLK